jgi:putative ABC transport system permease protein
MVIAIALSVTAVTAFLSARAILGREITANYLAGNPASATLHLPGGVRPADLNTAAAQPGITGVTARDTLLLRVKVGSEAWQPLLLFVSEPDDPSQLSTVAVERGSWPPSAQELFLERTALPFLGVRVGDTVRVRAPGGSETTLTVGGAVHDPGVAPAGQERTAYGQVTTASLARLGLPDRLTELKITVGDERGPSGDLGTVTTTAQRVGATLSAAGRPVTGIDVPAPLRHPHYGQMVTVGFVLLAFGGASLLLSSILVATMLGGMLTEQIRQIGAMKAVGARTGQLLAMYLALATVLAVLATGLALYPGLALGGSSPRLRPTCSTSTSPRRPRRPGCSPPYSRPGSLSRC